MITDSKRVKKYRKLRKIKASVPKPLLSTNKYAILSLVGIPTKDKG